MAEHYPLYDAAEAYDCLFLGQADEELRFYRSLLSKPAYRPLVSLGCGSARLESGLQTAGITVVGFDVSRQMIAACARRGLPAVVGDMANPPLRGPFGGAISGLLSAAYLTRREDIQNLVSWMGGALIPGAPVALELPVAHRPSRLQGISERAEIPAGVFEFCYLDEERREPEYSVLHTLITVELNGQVYERRAPLAVYTPDGIRSLLEDAGLFESTQFYAPYDMNTGTETPPEDCLRAIVVSQRSGVRGEDGWPASSTR